MGCLGRPPHSAVADGEAVHEGAVEERCVLAANVLVGAEEGASGVADEVPALRAAELVLVVGVEEDRILEDQVIDLEADFGR